jgi:hypothetical protein
MNRCRPGAMNFDFTIWLRIAEIIWWPLQQKGLLLMD